MATTTPTAKRKLDRDDLLAIFGQLGDVGSVELKLTVPAPDHIAVRQLGLDPLDGRIRAVVYFDRPDLALFRAGVVVRGRRTQGDDDDTVVKLRPVVPGDLSPAVRDSPNLKVEMDVTRGSYLVSASLKGQRRTGAVDEVLGGERSVERLLSKELRALVAEAAPAGTDWPDLVPLGPIYVVVVKGRPSGFDHKVTVEQWHYPGQVPLMELSTKAQPLDAGRLYTEVGQYLRGLGLRASGSQEPKTRKALEFFARRLPAPSHAPLMPDG
jgi:hypothetical protein